MWLVGQVKNCFVELEDVVWEFQGVFDNEGVAITACRDRSYFVAPIELNKEFPHETQEFPDSYFPVQGVTNDT